MLTFRPEDAKKIVVEEHEEAFWAVQQFEDVPLVPGVENRTWQLWDFVMQMSAPKK
ncbi:hypothetical protein Cri9333_0702 [Crinalium epipsammum PCC 9333]|uniref:Uncharacterized protein n=1 Tax=Crinalium epipsammum PCC 9333 TaxID=1173022 RepID=K9VVP5_9CYAN|nr:hypothetical protein [Crinalium epipsammum]AFZ11634.1 hypothetical protein Cri9333_0702 [Crinalium epipsammum PCC 9333]